MLLASMMEVCLMYASYSLCVGSLVKESFPLISCAGMQAIDVIQAVQKQQLAESLASMQKSDV